MNLSQETVCFCTNKFNDLLKVKVLMKEAPNDEDGSMMIMAIFKHLRPNKGAHPEPTVSEVACTLLCVE